MHAMKLRRLLIRLLCFAVVLVGAFTPLWAQSAPESATPGGTAGDVEITVGSKGFGGKVSDVAGKSAGKGTKIEVRDRDTGKIVASMTTDKLGRYTLGKLAPGKYELLVSGQKLGMLAVSAASTVTTVNLVVPATVLAAGTKVGPLAVTVVTLAGAGTTVVVVQETDAVSGDEDLDTPATPVNP